MPKGELLLEVRCEEIPSRMLEPAAAELEERLGRELAGCGMVPRRLTVAVTPRRLAVVAEGLPDQEPDTEEEVVGPPASVAFDEEGEPTQAALGFARRCGVGVEELRREEREKGEYLVCGRRVGGRPTPEILAKVLPRVVTSLAWAKTMRWGAGVGPWVRPVHGVVALFAGGVVDFELYGVAAGSVSAGHPVLSPDPFEVTGAADWRRKLQKRGIEVDQEARRSRLRERLAELAAEAGGELVEDEELLHKVAAMCEIPGAVLGGFDRGFLALPREVLSTSLRDHQSAFTVEKGDQLMPSFLTVMDRSDDPEERVRKGNEWVVEARLADARFFYQEDRKVSLTERVARLDHLSFHEQLGSYAEKAKRLEEMARIVCDELGWEDEGELATQAARLLKADLTTDMVKEFTSLQGVVGGVYAHEEGFPSDIWHALYDQYLPASVTDPVPRGRVGKVTALVDRVDTLAGIFGIGLVPSGSKDPFGLRRAAQGAVRILLEGDLSLDLEMLAARAVRLYGDRLTRSGEEVLATLRPFLHDRIRYLLERQGFLYDEIEAALGAGASDLPDLRARVQALHEVREEPVFLSIVLAAKRIANIVRDAPEHQLDTDLLEEEAEIALHRAFEELRSEVEEGAEAGEYPRCLAAVVGLADVLDRFFVEVLVMAENQRLKENRIGLLQAIHRTLSRTAELTELVVDKAEYRSRAEGAPE